MPEHVLPSEVSNRIYDILVEECGARESMREDFIRYHEDGCYEFRFCGSLGFGGKFYSRSRWYVGCYSEDVTELRDEAIYLANYRLDALRLELMQVPNA